MPDASTPSTPYVAIGGEAGVRALVDAFYDRMDVDDAFAGIRALHGATLDNAREKLFLYLCGWLGGPQRYVERFGHPRLRARHLPFPIGTSERDQWLACMQAALDDAQVPTPLKPKLIDAFTGVADWMRNRDG